MGPLLLRVKVGGGRFFMLALPEAAPSCLYLCAFLDE